jgi:Icc protein
VARPFLLLQLSDPHLGAEWGDGDPLGRLREAVARAAALPDRPDALVLSGDLTDNGSVAGYASLREALEPLGLEPHVLPGNHDEREPLRAAFGLSGAGTEPVNHAADLGPLRLLCLDSTVPGEVRGVLDRERLGWLDAELAAAPQQPTVLALHHPPLDPGMAAWDDDNLGPADRLALAEVLGRHPQLRLVIGGHLHRTVTASLAGRPVLAAPSTYMQAAPDFGIGAAELTVPVAGFALHALRDGELSSHVETWLAAAPAPPTGPRSGA